MILCAAIKAEIRDNTGSRILVIPCRRHGDRLAIVQEMRNISSDPNLNINTCQGFITNKGEFLDRVDALEHAKECGQLSESTLWYKDDHCDTELFSEDLY